MPLYDYQCKSCEESFTELRKTSEKDEPIACPSCGHKETKRLVTGFAFGGGGSGGGAASYSPPTSGFS